MIARSVVPDVSRSDVAIGIPILGTALTLATRFPGYAQHAIVLVIIALVSGVVFLLGGWSAGGPETTSLLKFRTRCAMYGVLSAGLFALGSYLYFHLC
jgi:hypothetical protein